MKNKGFIIESIAILIIIVVVAIIGINVYQNVTFGTKQGIIIDKQYHAPWVSYNTSYVNDNHISIPVTHPESWSVKIKKDDKELWIDISENEYDSLKIGDCYHCESE